MKKISLIILTILGISMLQSCKINKPIMENLSNSNKVKQDKDFNNLAIIVSTAIHENIEFKK